MKCFQFGLQISIKTKNKPTQLNEKRYKTYINKLNHLLRIAEKQHIEQLFAKRIIIIQGEDGQLMNYQTYNK